MSGIVLNVKIMIASGTPHVVVRKIGDSTIILTITMNTKKNLRIEGVQLIEFSMSD